MPLGCPELGGAVEHLEEEQQRSQLGLLVPVTQAVSCAAGKNRLRERRASELPPRERAVLSINKAAYGKLLMGMGRRGWGGGNTEQEEGSRARNSMISFPQLPELLLTLLGIILGSWDWEGSNEPRVWLAHSTDADAETQQAA